MITARKVGFVSATLAVVALAASLGYWYVNRPDRDYTKLTQPTRVEMMPESSGEWIERHIPRENKTLVQYRNGDTGIRLWRNDHTLSEEFVYFFNGRTRSHTLFAADGKQIVGGFAVRDDLSTIWEAQLDERTKMVLKTTYWYDGKAVFSQEKRRVAADREDVMYFHRNGNKWKHYVGPVVRDSNPSIEEVWNLQGVLVFAHRVGLNETSTDFFYRDDGSLEFEQFWTTRNFCSMEGCSGPVKVLGQTNVLASDGETIQRKLIMREYGSAVERAVDYNADRSYTESVMTTTIAIGIISHYDANDKLLDTRKYRLDDNAPKLQVDERMLSDQLGKVDPEKIWQVQETNPALRTNDGP